MRMVMRLRIANTVQAKYNHHFSLTRVAPAAKDAHISRSKNSIIIIYL
jgi:hypothetical protein